VPHDVMQICNDMQRAYIVVEVSLQRQWIIVTINAKIILYRGLVETLFFSSKLIFISYTPTRLSTATCYYVIITTTCVFYMSSLYFFNERIQFNFFHTTIWRIIKVQTEFDARVDMCTILQYCKESFCVFVLQSSF